MATRATPGLASHDPTPEEAASLTETLEFVMRGLDEAQQRMLVLRLEGYTVAEISQEVRRSERTVQRVLGLVRKGLKRVEELAT